MKIPNFLKVNWKVTLIIAGVIFAVVWFSIKQHQVKVLTGKITTLETNNIAIDKQRALLEVDKKQLIFTNTIISIKNDSLKKVLAKYQVEFVNLKKQHEKELAELSKIPSDTVFKLLQPFYPNYDNSPLKYPFASSQITGIYKTTILFGQLNEEYSLQTKSLNSCFALNTGFERSITNLNSQVGNLNSQISKCDLQNVNYTKNIDLLNKQVKNKTFWNRVQGGLNIALVVARIFKI